MRHWNDLTPNEKLLVIFAGAIALLAVERQSLYGFAFGLFIAAVVFIRRAE
jgi:type II secretory pathway component PulM